MHISKIGIAAASVAVAAVSSLAIGTPAHAAEASNPQLDAARTWLVDQLQEGLLPSSYGSPNYGASADAITSLSAIGDSTDVATIREALSSHVDSYISGDDQDPSDDSQAASTYEDVGSTYAGAVAKAATVLDPSTMTHLGGQPAGDLISRLEAQVQPSGRIQDTSTYGDYANVLGQAYAVDALTEAHSADAAKATAFLLSQQCSQGWFRQDFDQTTDANGNPLGTDESCDADAKSAPSVDATATVLAQLAPQADDGTASAEVTAAVTKAKAWLLSVQGKDGGWTDGGAGDPENTNSTGLAVFALGRLDPADSAPAGTAAGAAWIAARQLQNVGTCTPYAAADLGALAYDKAAWSAAQKTAVGNADDQFIVAASQALPALLFMPSATASGSVKLAPLAFAKAGATSSYTARGLTPYVPACFAQGSTRHIAVASSAGSAAAGFAMPKKSATVVTTVEDETGAHAQVSTRVLTAKKLTLKAPKSVHPGRTFKVQVRGLAPGEHLTFSFQGHKVAKVAGQGGTSVAKFRATRKKGRATVKVVGQFADRTGTTSVTVK